MPRGDMFAVIAANALVVMAVGCPSLDAQKPERKQEVTIPGTDVSLKAGWRLLFYKGCRFAVPVSWRPDADGCLAVAPDGSNVSIRTFTIVTWSAHKAQIRAFFGHVIDVHEDSEHRLWFEIGGHARVQHYVDVPNGLGVCSGLLEVRAATMPDAEETTKRVVESIGPAPERWPPDAIK